MESTWQAGASSSGTSGGEKPNFVAVAAEPYRIPQEETSGYIVYDEKYVDELRKTFREQQTETFVIRNNQRLGAEAKHIQQRLKAHDVAISTFTCLANHCGRSFDRIQVLAFHVSYAHQDLMTSHSNHLTCLLCGKKWTTVRRKIMHLSLAHKDVGEEHNAQCMQQVESVIAPNAPKAQRLQKARYEGVVYQPAEEYLEEVVEDDVDEDVEFDYYDD